MSLFSFGRKKPRFGIIIDIGSGSVLTAIVHSAKSMKHPMIVWAHREHIALKEIDSVERSAHAVLAALVNASIKLDTEGRKTLEVYYPGAKLSVLQSSIAAPWSYTVTKTLNLQQEEDIPITEHLIDELVSAAQRQVEEDLKQHSDTISQELAVITKSTMDLLTNGYRVRHPEGAEANTIQLTQATVVVQQYMIDSLTEMQQKLFPNTKIEAMSFILMFYYTIRSLYPHTDDICLVDITDEASELGIIRDGSLTYSTHIPFGMFSLAREIAKISNITLHEALGYLRADDIAGVSKHLPEHNHPAVDAVFDAYIQKLAALFNETGDSLSIPKRMFIHVEASFEPLFRHLTTRAAKIATKIDPAIESFATNLIPQEQKTILREQIGDYIHDTALLLNAEFFHKEQRCLDFNCS